MTNLSPTSSNKQLGKLLFLGYGSGETRLIDYLTSQGWVVTHEAHKIDDSKRLDFDMIVSFGYRYKISDRVLNSTKGPNLNLHISLLPWNKGAHPIFWSYFEGTPTGVTIHELDGEFDTGTVYGQKIVELNENYETFETAYIKHRVAIEDLFIELFPVIVNGEIIPEHQFETGTYHTSSELPPSFAGWGSVISDEINRLKSL